MYFFIRKTIILAYPIFFTEQVNSQTENEIGPILPSTGDEGPSCIKIGNEYRVYTDPFESDKAYIFISKNLKNWHRETSDLKMSHGSVIEIPQQLADRLLNK